MQRKTAHPLCILPLHRRLRGAFRRLLQRGSGFAEGRVANVV